jgi:hypothetical protein
LGARCSDGDNGKYETDKRITLIKMSILDAFYMERPTKGLYHYTDSTGLYAILSSKTMRASHIQFLNDSSEFCHASKMILNRIERAIDENHDERIARMLFSIKEAVETITPNTFVISFSENRDVLSQWRGYCPNGGYNIAFSPSAWEGLLEKNSYAMVRCQYQEADQKRLIDCLVESAITAFCSFNPPSPLHDPSYIYTEEHLVHLFAGEWFWNKAQKLATAIKNREFEEEREWRVIGGLKKTKLADDVRTKGSLLVPYQNFSIALNNSLNHVVTGVTISPNLNANLAQFGVERFKYHCGVTEVWDVVQSKVPYRQL